MSEAPEKIYGWLDSQLSIARFYGGITFHGQNYVIDTKDPKQPLVRSDIHNAEQKERASQQPIDHRTDTTLSLF